MINAKIVKKKTMTLNAKTSDKAFINSSKCIEIKENYVGFIYFAMICLLNI